MNLNTSTAHNQKICLMYRLWWGSGDHYMSRGTYIYTIIYRIIWNMQLKPNRKDSNIASSDTPPWRGNSWYVCLLERAYSSYLNASIIKQNVYDNKLRWWTTTDLIRRIHRSIPRFQRLFVDLSIMGLGECASTMGVIVLPSTRSDPKLITLSTHIYLHMQ